MCQFSTHLVIYLYGCVHLLVSDYSLNQNLSLTYLLYTRYDLLRELDTLKETFIERDQICAQQKNEIHKLQKDIGKLEKENASQKQMAAEEHRRTEHLEVST